MFLALRSFAHKSAILEHSALLQPLQNVQKCPKRRNVRTHLVPIPICYLAGHT